MANGGMSNTGIVPSRLDVLHPSASAVLRSEDTGYPRLMSNYKCTKRASCSLRLTRYKLVSERSVSPEVLERSFHNLDTHDRGVSEQQA